ncbi:MAG: phosphomannomutase [Pseudomonadota bacterium]
MPQFGTSGLRGLSTDLTDALCASYAAAFVSQHKHNGRLFVGQDRRDSSPRIAAAVARGAAGQGLDIVDCGVLPTPALAGAALAEGTLSIMVTGSHIPADRNGLKFYTSLGEFTKSDEAPLADAIKDWTLEEAAPNYVPFDAASAYVARFTDGIASNALAGRKVGMWVHSSAASEVLPTILCRLGAEVVELLPSDNFIPVDTEAVDEEMRLQLAELVASHGLDAIVSTDGDADRPLMIDDQGRVMPGDILGPITANWVGASEVVTTVSANTMVDALGSFAQVARTKIGSPYVIAAMEERMAAGVGSVAGYEPNGGFLLGWDATGTATLPKLMTRDSTLPLVATLAQTTADGVSLSAMLERLPIRRTATDRLQDVPREKSLALVDDILAGDMSMMPDMLGSLSGTDTTDGVRLTFDTARVVHIRPSGNAPELRCYVEAESSEAASEVLVSVLDSLRKRVT